MQGMHLQEADFLCDPENVTSFTSLSTFSHLQPHLQLSSDSLVYQTAARMHM